MEVRDMKAPIGALCLTLALVPFDAAAQTTRSTGGKKGEKHTGEVSFEDAKRTEKKWNWANTRALRGPPPRCKCGRPLADEREPTTRAANGRDVGEGLRPKKVDQVQEKILLSTAKLKLCESTLIVKPEPGVERDPIFVTVLHSEPENALRRMMKNSTKQNRLEEFLPKKEGQNSKILVGPKGRESEVDRESALGQGGEVLVVRRTYHLGGIGRSKRKNRLFVAFESQGPTKGSVHRLLSPDQPVSAIGPGERCPECDGKLDKRGWFKKSKVEKLPGK